MSNNNLKKTIVYTSLSNKQIIENYLSLSCAVTKQTVSGAWESILLEGILPHNKDAKEWSKEILIEPSSMGKIISYIYSYLAGGIMGKSRYIINLDLIRYSQSCLIYGFNNEITKEEHQFFSCYDSIIHIFENKLKEITSVPYEERISNYDHIVYELTQRINGLKETRKSTEFFYATDFTHYILSSLIENWDIVSDNTMTYRFLSSLARIQNWYYSPDRIMELLDIIKRISFDWE